MSDKNPPLLQVRNVRKSFSGNDVLKDINFDLDEGEILGLVGENGAGKSTLMNILFGMKEIAETGGYEGEILLNGAKVNFTSSFDALNAGLGMVHQEFSLLGGFTAAENIVLNRESLNRNVLGDLFGERMNTIDNEGNLKRAIEAISKLSVALDEKMLVDSMPVGHKQFTEISRELSRVGIRILLLDEPTAVLSEKEAEGLLDAMRILKSSGISIIFITHRLAEIIDVCDKVIVMRDGQIVDTIRKENADVRSIARAMVGRDVKGDDSNSSSGKIAESNSDDFILSVRGLYVDMPGEIVRNVNLDVRWGEILGIAGLAGQGKLGIPNGIMKLYPSGGRIIFDGKDISCFSTRDCLKSGIAFVSEDRRGVGLLLDESLEWNIVFTAMEMQDRFLKKYGFITWRDVPQIEKTTRRYIDELQIKCTSSKQRARELSGGNQQKVCLAKAFCMNPKLLFVSEATRGIDIGAKMLVLEALREHNRENGTTIVLASSELEELRSVCDRIAVVADGRISGILPAGAPSEEFALLMVGHSSQSIEKGERAND